ncbi:MAG: SDR family oxidoreductase [Candidatus Melainabacteria bacterium]|nr:SDR family oxidoreductase [Candidatus Melainabacteria bacterium]MBI3309380.1 SDR family oxidoreductase [Candidatus Melainabacteria bacterium]
MRLVVTGGAGFVGSHLVDKLIFSGHEVVVIDNLITGSDRNLTLNKNLTFIEQNVAEYIDVEGKVDWVLHLASPASPADFKRIPIPILKAGSMGTINALGLAKAKKAKFLLASTSEVYGDPQEHPQKESYVGHVDCTSPRAAYDEAKRFAEAVTMAYYRFHNIDVRIVRIFNTYGPRMRTDDGRVVSNFVTQAIANKPITVYGDGTQTRSFQYISDLVEGILKLMESSYHLPVNIGNPHEFTVMELAKIVKRLTNSESEIIFKPLPEADPKCRRPDISVAKNILKWEPKVELQEGLKKTVEYYKSLKVGSA